jgi:hypothetical protein
MSSSSADNPPKARKFVLPAWLDHFNSRDLKVFFRCSVAAWVASLLMFIRPTLDTIGTATFFAWYIPISLGVLMHTD